VTIAAVKVAIVGGAGGVGASAAFNLVLMRGGNDIVLLDLQPELVTSHVMDLLTPGQLDALHASAESVRVATEGIP
jgi:malate/lactate dehydrogenase